MSRGLFDNLTDGTTALDIYQSFTTNYYNASSKAAIISTPPTLSNHNYPTMYSSDNTTTIIQQQQQIILENHLINISNNNQASISNDINFTILSILNQSTPSQTTNIDFNSDYHKIFSWQGFCLLLIYCIFIVITIIGNTLVILAVITTRRLRTVTNCFVMSLAIADLLVGIFVMPPEVALYVIGSWQLGWILCDIWISLDVLLCTASILSLCAISVDRYFAVTQPLTYSRKRRSKRLALTMILIVWLLALAITCPPILGWYEPERRDLQECRYNQNQGYVVFSAMGSFFIPMIVMIYVYARISCVIASRHDNMADISVHNKKNRKFHTVDADAELDQDTSEHDVSPSQKKQAAARTLSNQTIGKDLSDIVIIEDGNNGDVVARQSANKNGSYELISASRTPSFKRQPQTLSVPKTSVSAAAAGGGGGGLSPAHQQSSEHWSFGGAASATGHHHQRQSVRSQHHVNTTYNVGGGNDTYVTRNTRVHHQKSLSNRISSVKKENKTTQTLSIVVGGFIACWLPFFIYYLIHPFLNEEQISQPLFKFLTWLGWFNSAINPFIYAFYSVDFRAAFWRLTLKRFFGSSSIKGQYPTNTMSIRR